MRPAITFLNIQLSNSRLGKLQNMTDEEFAEISLEAAE